MALRNPGGVKAAIREILSLFKEGSVFRDATFLATNCFCGFHVINTHLITVALVSPPSYNPRPF